MQQSQPNINPSRKRPRQHDIGRQQHGEKRARNAVPTSTQPANRVFAGTLRPSLPDNRTVDFDVVYNGNHKHIIVEYPKHSNEWYILRCDQHDDIHFGRNPLQAAAKHLSGKEHGHQRKTFDVAVQMLGIRVLHCDVVKAKRNNLAFGHAWGAGYRPLRAYGPKMSQTSEKTQDGASYDLRSSAPTTTSACQEKPNGDQHVGETPTSLELQPQSLPSETLGQQPPTTVAAPTPGVSSASSPLVAMVQEVRQESSRQSTNGDPSSASERLPQNLFSLAQKALVVAGRDTSGIDPESLVHFGAARPSVSARPSTVRFGKEATWTPYQAHPQVTLPPIGVFLGDSWNISPTDSFTAPRAPPLPRPRTLLPRLLPSQNSHDNESNPADSDGQYSCPVCSKGFNRMSAMESHSAKKHGIKPPERELRSL